MSGGCVEGAVVSEALAILAGEREPRRRHVRLLRRRGVRGRAHVRRHDPPVRRAARLVSRASIYEALRDALRAERAGRAGDGDRGPERRRQAARAARAATRVGTLGDPDLDRVVARDALRRARGRAHVDPPLRRARRGARTTTVSRVHRVVRAAAADDHLRRGRLHRRARQGRQGARLPRDRVRRPGRCSRPCSGSRWPTRS